MPASQDPSTPMGVENDEEDDKETLIVKEKEKEKKKDGTNYPTNYPTLPNTIITPLFPIQYVPLYPIRYSTLE
jgi:hypothetical protein